MLDLFGQLHVLVIHLPIGLVMGLVAVEIYGKCKPEYKSQPLARLLLIMTAFSAVLACLFGLALVRHGEYSEVFWHKWSGITLGLTLLTTLWVHMKSEKIYRGGLACCRHFSRGPGLPCQMRPPV